MSDKVKDAAYSKLISHTYYEVTVGTTPVKVDLTDPAGDSSVPDITGKYLRLVAELGDIDYLLGDHTAAGSWGAMTFGNGLHLLNGQSEEFYVDPTDPEVTFIAGVASQKMRIFYNINS